MTEIADVFPRASLRESFRFFRIGRDAMRAAGTPLFKPKTIFPGLKGIVFDPHETSHVFTLFESMIGPVEASAIGYFLDSPRGKALLDAPPPLVERLLDREALAAMPEGSLGRAYLDFITREGISADGLVAASEQGRVIPRDDASRSTFIGDYLRDAHDLWHVVTGYQGDIVGELALLAFSFAQTGNLGVGLLVGLSATLGPVLPTPIDAEGGRTILEGFKRGWRARWLPTVDWLALLPLPLAEVRRGLGIDGPAEYRELRVAPGEALLQIAA